MIVIGLTGSIGMGKSTTLNMFARHDVPVHDADASVHDLYRGAAAPLIEAAFPGTTRNGIVDRMELSARVLNNPDAFATLESIIHPLVRQLNNEFREGVERSGKPICVVDVPLLFETGGDKRVDVIVVVTADAATQRQRVLSREGMTEDRFNAILAKQMPDAEKRNRADYIIDTGLGLEAAEHQVEEILQLVVRRDSETAGITDLSGLLLTRKSLILRQIGRAVDQKVKSHA